VRRPPTRERLVDVWIEAQILRVLRLRMVSAVLAGRAPGAEASVRKAIADAHGQHIMDVARDLAGPFGMLAGCRVVDRSGWPSGRPHLVPRFLVLARAHHRRRHG
jgi:alkylation response protein AidB-like acyl-CoA dehydrogenase